MRSLNTRLFALPHANAPLREVSEAETRDYERDGVVLLKGIYPADWVANSERNLDDIFNRNAENSFYSDDEVLEGETETGVRIDLVAQVKAIQSLDPTLDFALDGVADTQFRGRSLVEADAASRYEGMRLHHTRGPLPQIVAQLLRSRKVKYYADQLFCKDAGSKIRTPFHQDKPYFLLQGSQVAVCWVSPDRVDRANGAMGYALGSHAWGKLFKPSDFITRAGSAPQAEDTSHEGLETIPRIEDDEEKYQVTYFDYEPGDVLIHNWATIHGSARNTSTKRGRRAASVRYAGENVTYYERPSSPESFRKTLSLEDGDPLEKALRFPVVFPNVGLVHDADRKTAVQDADAQYNR